MKFFVSTTVGRDDTRFAISTVLMEDGIGMSFPLDMPPQDYWETVVRPVLDDGNTGRLLEMERDWTEADGLATHARLVGEYVAANHKSQGEKGA